MTKNLTQINLSALSIVNYNEAIRSGSIIVDAAPAQAADFSGYVDSPGREVILSGEIDGQIVGWVIVKYYSDRPGYRYACETSVYVADAHQRPGHGSRLLDAVIASALGLGYRHLVAKILVINETRIGFHQGFGFEMVGRQWVIGYLNGTWHDVVILRRVLDATQPERLAQK